MDAIANTANPTAMDLWLAVVWLKYKGLVPQAQERLGAVTEEVSQGRGRANTHMHLSGASSELRKAEDVLTQYNARSTDLAAIGFRTIIFSRPWFFCLFLGGVNCGLILILLMASTFSFTPPHTCVILLPLFVNLCP